MAMSVTEIREAWTALQGFAGMTAEIMTDLVNNGYDVSVEFAYDELADGSYVIVADCRKRWADEPGGHP